MPEKIKCPDCDFEAKNKNGLRLHSKKHNKQSSIQPIQELTDEQKGFRVLANGKIQKIC